MVADVEKAFLQISLNLDHRDLVCFLWFKDIEKLDLERFENIFNRADPGLISGCCKILQKKLNIEMM